MRIVIYLLYVAAAWKWGDWRNWKKYYPTYLFMIAVDFFASILTYNHTLWRFEPSFLLPNHTITDFCAAVVVFPSTVLLYLSRFPGESLLHQLAWMAVWVGIYSAHETLSSFMGLMAYEHDWSLGKSIMFNSMMFPILRVHYLNPGLAWALFVLATFFIWHYFGFSLQELK